MTFSAPRAGRAAAILAALGFIGLSVLLKVVCWEALAFLGERSVARGTLAGAAALGATMAVTRLLWRRQRPLADDRINLFPAGRADLRAGLTATLAGGALFASAFGLVVLTGGLADFTLKLEGTELILWLLGVLVATILNAAWEEYTFRGWPFLVGVRALGPHAVALAVGTVFGLAHTLNPHWTVWAVLSVSLAGWLLGYTLLASRSLAAVIGLHVGWNLVQSLLTSQSLWSYTKAPEALRSGGAYGVEASAPGILVTACAAAFCVRWFVRGQRETPGTSA
ncbi:MAG: CPBP family intramembrane metalloprotease [Deltaproteobacteria bacterium]|nr:CPBP family intramembrane metalloprotease [Deltaproteobacteria bacterium]